MRVAVVVVVAAVVVLIMMPLGKSYIQQSPSSGFGDYDSGFSGFGVQNPGSLA